MELNKDKFYTEFDYDITMSHNGDCVVEYDGLFYSCRIANKIDENIINIFACDSGGAEVEMTYDIRSQTASIVGESRIINIVLLSYLDDYYYEKDIKNNIPY